MPLEKLNFKWLAKRGQYESGDSLYLNKIRVGEYSWNSSRSRDEAIDKSKDWIGNVALPGLLNKTVFGSNQSEIKTKIEQLVNYWFDEVLKSEVKTDG